MQTPQTAQEAAGQVRRSVLSPYYTLYRYAARLYFPLVREGAQPEAQAINQIKFACWNILQGWYNLLPGKCREKLREVVRCAIQAVEALEIGDQVALAERLKSILICLHEGWDVLRKSGTRQ